MFIVDAHLDLAYNAIRHNRDLLRPVAELRARELNGARPNGTATVSFPAMQSGRVGLVFGTMFVEPAGYKPNNEGLKLTYSTADQAHKWAQMQLDYYHRLADEQPHISLVGDVEALDALIEANQQGEQRVGILPLMEGADPIREPAEAEIWAERGLRMVGLAWDDTRYSGGAWRGQTGLSRDGRRLLEIMADLGLMLDLTHMSEKATLEALDIFEGRLAATHANARALVPGERQLSDLQLRRIAERDGVVGVVLANGFLHKENWEVKREMVTIGHVAAQIDHICQTVGDARHAGIGSDLDGGFGLEKIPTGFESVEDLSLIGTALEERGYSGEDVENIMGGNWLRFLRESLNDR